MTEEEKSIFVSAIVELVNSNVDAIAGGLSSAVRGVKNKIDTATKTIFKDYLETSLKKYYATKTIINSAEPIPLESIYVGLSLKSGKREISGEMDDLIYLKGPFKFEVRTGFWRKARLEFGSQVIS
jgi:hypothetical protein